MHKQASLEAFTMMMMAKLSEELRREQQHHLADFATGVVV